VCVSINQLPNARTICMKLDMCIMVATVKCRSIAVPVTGRGGLQGCEMVLKLSTLRTGHALLPRNILFFSLFLVILFVSGGVNPRAIVRLQGLDKLKNFIGLIGTQTPNLLACSLASQPTTLSYDPPTSTVHFINPSHQSVCLYV
jgi:hypothetical protein